MAGAGKPMKGLLLIAGKPPKGKSMPDEEGPSPNSERGGSEELSASEAFQAIQDGDEEAFKAAFLRAVRACVAKEMAEGY